MALITALLYLVILSLLVVSGFSTSLLQTKISLHINQETQALENAEAALTAGENAILTDAAVIDGDSTQGSGKVNDDAVYQFSAISRPECGAYFQIEALGTLAAAKSKLESVLLIPNAGSNPCPEPTDPPHRVMWRELP